MATKPPHPNRHRAIIAMAIIGAFIVVYLVHYFMFLSRLLEAQATKAYIADAAIDWVTAFQPLLSLSFGLAAAAFICWFWQAYRNLHLRVDHPLSYAPGWAIGAWFVPWVGAVLPYIMIQEMYTRTQGLLSKQQPYALHCSLPKIWWLLCLLYGVTYLAMTIFMSFGNNIGAAQILLVNRVLLIASGVATLLLIYHYAQAEQRLYAMEQEESYTEDIAP